MESTLSPRAPAEEILTVEQVANRLQLKPSWVYAHADQLGAYRTGKYLRFRWQRVLERLEQSPIETNGPQPSTVPLHWRKA
ncbi:MAG: hypothetical protein DMG70_03305 [Acidobacteria bacterium]|nr:MAG: hypothetical protein DMG70_03305 [Acidobacteriota bacterium]